MSIHTLAFYQAATANAALAAIPAVADGTVRVVTNDVYVPKGMANILAAAVLINSAAATARGQFQSPSLRALLNYDVSPIGNGLVFGSDPAMDQNWDTPIPLMENEPLELWIQNGAAVVNQGIVWIGDGPVKPVTGKIYTLRFTTAITLSAGVWVNGPITFGQTLPAGHYQVVGLRVVGANLVAARLFFVGSGWRPGVLGSNLEANIDPVGFRGGQYGVIGEFDNTTPPTLDAFGVTDTTQIGYMDLIKTA